jgi:hypothetical protein
MNKCKFQGIWLVLLVTAGARASMTNCKVNLTTAHTLPVHGTGQHVVGFMIALHVVASDGASAPTQVAALL